MMDTVLNLGLNDRTVEALITATQNERFALDCYRRFMQMFSEIVLEIDIHKFEEVLEQSKRRLGLELDQDLTGAHLRAIVDEYKRIIKKASGKEFPQEPVEQLKLAVKAVFNPAIIPRAQVYRKLNRIPDDLGTAVSVQAMVFGNIGDTSGTGVAFTRPGDRRKCPLRRIPDECSGRGCGSRYSHSS